MNVPGYQMHHHAKSSQYHSNDKVTESSNMQNVQKIQG